MKKLLLITSIFIISVTSMNLSGCHMVGRVINLIYAMSGSNYLSKGDGQEITKYCIYAGENGTIYRSFGEDNIIFEQKNSGTTERLNYVRTTPSAFNGTVLIMGNNGTILLSTNTGENWSVSPAITSANLCAVDFNSVFYYAAGDNGTILKSVSGGVNWFQLTSGTTRNIKALSINNQSGSTIIAVGEKGTILRTTDGGLNWVNISISDTSINFYDITKKAIYYNNGTTFIAVGSGGNIYKSTNGGLNWIQKTSGTTNTLRSIYQHTTDSVVAAGDNGTIRFSTNGGESWFTDSFFTSPSTRHFKSVSLVNRDNKTFSALSDTVFFISNEPIILGLNNVNTAIPQVISLHQNYPNPFNPATKIGFELPKGSFAKLVVYDITGKEIKTLVNEDLNAGTYEYEWNALTLPSGIYLYKLEAGNYTQTRKMILIK